MRTAVAILLLACCQAAAGQELSNTDLDSLQIIRMTQESWRLHKLRDPAEMAQLRINAKSPESGEVTYTVSGRMWHRQAIARSLLATYYDNYELFDFKVSFQSAESATLTYKFVMTGHARGKRLALDDYTECKLRKTAGRWKVVAVVFRATR